MTSAQISWDREADAIYVRFTDEPVESTIALSTSVYIDVDANGNPVGLEVLKADANLISALQGLSNSATLRDLIAAAA